MGIQLVVLNQGSSVSFIDPYTGQLKCLALPRHLREVLGKRSLSDLASLDLVLVGLDAYQREKLANLVKRELKFGAAGAGALVANWVTGKVAFGAVGSQQGVWFHDLEEDLNGVGI